MLCWRATEEVPILGELRTGLPQYPCDTQLRCTDVRATGLALLVLVMACQPAASGSSRDTSHSTASAPAASPSPATPAAIPSAAATPLIRVSTARGNFDGAGGDEAASVSGNDQLGWTISFVLHEGHELDGRLEGFFSGCHSAQGGLYLPHILGVGDFTAGGRDEVLVQVWHGASTGDAAIFGVDRGSITAATVVDGANVCQRVFPFNGSVTHGNGLACTSVAGAPGLQVLQATDNPPTDYDTYEWYRANYQWRGLDLHLVTLEHAVLRTGDPRLQAAWEVHCPGLPTNLL